MTCDTCNNKTPDCKKRCLTGAYLGYIHPKYPDIKRKPYYCEYTYWNPIDTRNHEIYIFTDKDFMI